MKTKAEIILQSKSREAGLADLSKIITDWMMEIGMFQSCINCCDWNNDKEMCVKFKMRPPAKVIVSGCEFHSDIPF